MKWFTNTEALKQFISVVPLSFCHIRKSHLKFNYVYVKQFHLGKRQNNIINYAIPSSAEILNLMTYDSSPMA